MITLHEVLTLDLFKKKIVQKPGDPQRAGVRVPVPAKLLTMGWVTRPIATPNHMRYDNDQ